MFCCLLSLHTFGGRWMQLSAEHWWTDTHMQIPYNRRKTCPSATLSTTNPTLIALDRRKSTTNRLRKDPTNTTKLRTVFHWSYLWNVWDRNISIVSALATSLKPIRVLSKVYSGWRNRSVKFISHVRLRFTVRTFSLYWCDECIRCVGVMQHCGWLSTNIMG
jgi:hypothetical protein